MTQREKLIELLGNVPASTNGEKNIERIAEYLLENGVIAPPCKVGEKVYVANGGGIKEAAVTEIYSRCGEDATILLAFDCYLECEKCPFQFYSTEASGEYTCAAEYGVWDISYSDFGKTVFLSSDEAEKAVKEFSEVNGNVQKTV